MGRDDMLQTAVVQLCQQLRRTCVIQMTEPAVDALLERACVGSVHQHFEIVIAFQYQRVATAQHLFDMRR